MWHDNEADLDLLGFEYLVDGLLVALTEPRLLPLTIGVLGDWGSGKSTLMRLAAAELNPHLELTNDQDDGTDPQTPVDGGAEESAGSGTDETPRPYLTIPFSPWQYEDFDDVKVALMNTVLDALDRRIPGAEMQIGRLRGFVGTLKRWGRRLGRAGSAAAPTVMPFVIQAAAPGTDPETAKLIGDLTSVAAKQLEPVLTEPSGAADQQAAAAGEPITDVGEFRTEFAKLIASAADLKAVIVFVDDLDRCLPETIVDTFEAIRLFLNTEKTAYVLALNQTVVESAIDSRYPDLKRADGGGIGRDYLEKMLQLTITIPAVSAPEAETYANLLFAELHLPEDDFEKVVQQTKTNRAGNALSVAFNAGIAGDVLKDIPPALAADLAWAADIMPVLGASLRGNPRQLKRFLNNLLLKHRSAALRSVDLKLPVLAKLMVLEDQYNSEYQRLFYWQMAADGPSPQLRAAEDYARSAGVQADDPEPVHGEGQDGTAAPSAKAAKRAQGAEPAVDEDLRSWADKQHIHDWLTVEPPLRGVDLGPYFTYSRDKLSFGVSASRLTPALQLLMSQVQLDVDRARRSHYPTVAALDPSERAQFVEALMDRVRRDPKGIALTAALELAELNLDVIDAVAGSLYRIPAAAIPPAAGTTAVLRFPSDHPAASALLDHWQGSDNAALAAMVTSARQAQTKSRR